MTDDGAVARHLPLRPVELQILASLGPGPRHGYAILQDTRARGEVRAVPGLATLYRGLSRLEGEGLIERTGRNAEVDDRRRTYGLTPLGRGVLAAEARRLAALVELTRSAGILSGEEGT